MNKSEQTVQSIFNLFFLHFQNPSLQQFSILYSATIMILKYFNTEGKYNEVIAKELLELFFHPIQTLNEKHENLKLPNIKLDWAIPQIEWIYWRDTRFKSKLSKEYFVDSRKEQQTKKIDLSEILLLLSLFKLELFQKIVEILLAENIDLMIYLPSGMKELKQVGSDEFG